MPSSYQAPMRKDKAAGRTQSQSQDSNFKAKAGAVGDILERKGRSMITIRPQDTLGKAVEVLRDNRIGALMVTDSQGGLCGILSERDIVRKLADMPGKTLPHEVQEVMTERVETCKPEDELVSILQRMSEGRFRHMPVLDNGVLAGMITIGDVVNYRLQELEHEALQLKQLIVG